MSDLISRQAAIAAIEKYDFSFPEYMERFVTELRDAMKEDLKDDIANLPSAQPEQRWIPCSERLPAKRRSVLITTSEGFVGEACYWETTENHVIWKGYRWNATYWDDEVLAWMPLPTPYREENEE